MRALIFCFSLLLSLSGCAPDREAPSAFDGDAVLALEEADFAERAPGRAALPKAAAPAAPPAAPRAQSAGQKLIKNGSLQIEVDDYDQARARILERVAAHDAYLGSESENRHDGVVRNQITIRVPAARFDALLDALVALAETVDHRHVSVVDVTEEFVDVEARLRTRREVEARYREILTRARTIDEILSVERQLQMVREEIEAAEGRLNVLRDRVAYSTIDLAYYKTTPLARPNRGFFSRVVRAARVGWIGLGESVIALVAVWPLVLVGALLVWGAVFLRGRVRARRAAAD